MSARFELPAVGEPSSVAFPAIERFALSNGLRVWFIPHGGVPAVTVSMVLDGGVSGDPLERPGLASLVGSLVTEGAGGRDSIEMSDALARIGGHVAVESGADVSVIALTTLAANFEKGMRLFADVIRRPMFLPQDFERARDLRKGRLIQASRSPSSIADRALLQAVFGDHPYGHGAFGTTRSLESMTIDELKSHWANSWGPACGTLLVSGDVSALRVESVAKAEFGDWLTDARPPVRTYVAAGLQPGGRGSVMVIDRPGASQSELRVGHHGPPRRTPDFHPLLVLNAVLGGQFTSRLNRNLRETRAITYGVRSSFEMRRVGGLFSCDTSVQADATAVAIAEMLRECRHVAVEGDVQPEELTQAKASLTRGYVRHFETASHLVRAMTQLATHDLPPEVFDEFVPAIEAVDVAAVTRVAGTAILPDQASVIVVGDLGRLGESLSQLDRTVTPIQIEF